MSVVSGVYGDVTLPSGHNASIATWSADLLQQLNDVTSFNDAPWGVVIGSIKRLRGSAGGFVKSNESNSTPGFNIISVTGGSFVLKVDDTNASNYAFTGVIGRINISQDVNSVARCVFDFESSGAVTETWDQTS
jgi:hypothetical protein